jgi:nitrate reductase NapAB chaperone NapD
MDSYISEIIVVIDAERCSDLDNVAAKLKAAGMSVIEVNCDEGIIEGTVPTSVLKKIESVAGVDYVRIVFTYNAHSDDDEPVKRAG